MLQFPGPFFFDGRLWVPSHFTYNGTIHDYIKSHPDELNQLIDVLIIHLSDFFRDPLRELEGNNIRISRRIFVRIQGVMTGA